MNINFYQKLWCIYWDDPINIILQFGEVVNINYIKVVDSNYIKY